jgi:hypothetical protein
VLDFAEATVLEFQEGFKVRKPTDKMPARLLSLLGQLRSSIQHVDTEMLNNAAGANWLHAMKWAGSGNPFFNEQKDLGFKVLTPKQAVVLFNQKPINSSTFSYIYAHVEEVRDNALYDDKKKKKHQRNVKLNQLCDGICSGLCEWCPKQPDGNTSKCTTEGAVVVLNCIHNHMVCLHKLDQLTSSTNIKTSTILCPVCELGGGVPAVGFVGVDGTEAGHGITADKCAIVVDDGGSKPLIERLEKFDLMSGGESHKGVKRGKRFEAIEEDLGRMEFANASKDDKLYFAAEYPHLGRTGDAILDALTSSDASSKLKSLVRLVLKIHREAGDGLKLVIMAKEEPTLSTLSAIRTELLNLKEFKKENIAFLVHQDRSKTAQRQNDFDENENVQICLFPFDR